MHYLNIRQFCPIINLEIIVSDCIGTSIEIGQVDSVAFFLISRTGFVTEKKKFVKFNSFIMVARFHIKWNTMIRWTEIRNMKWNSFRVTFSRLDPVGCHWKFVLLFTIFQLFFFTRSNISTAFVVCCSIH